MSLQPLDRRGLVRTALAIAAAFAVAPALAQDAFPNKPITIVVPFAPGGSLDVTARILGERMKETLGQQVVVSNKPGAGSTVGARTVAGAAADGYTVLLASGSAYGFGHMLVKGFDHKLSDFEPFAGISNNTSLIAVNAALPVKTLAELVALARAKPGSISFCTTGVNGLNHLQLEMLKRQVKEKGAAFDVTHVPYNGVAPALTALRAGDVQACTLPYSGQIKQFDGKEIRVIAMQAPKRIASMPNTPTTGEQGYPVLDGNEALVNFAAPKGTPPAVLQKLEDAVRAAMQDPAIVKRLEEIDVQPVFVGSRDTKKWLEEDVRKFGTIIREANLAAQQ